MDGVGVSNESQLEEAAVERAVAVFRRAVRANALNNSKSREDIVRLALTCGGHFSVHDLHRLQRANSLASVYRTIRLMVTAGLLAPTLLARGDGQLYERTFERARHDHMICTDCGKVIEFTSTTIDALRGDIAERFQFLLTDHYHELHGRCGDCEKRRVQSYRVDTRERVDESPG